MKFRSLLYQRQSKKPKTHYQHLFRDLPDLHYVVPLQTQNVSTFILTSNTKYIEIKFHQIPNANNNM